MRKWILRRDLIASNMIIAKALLLERDNMTAEQIDECSIKLMANCIRLADTFGRKKVKEVTDISKTYAFPLLKK